VNSATMKCPWCLIDQPDEAHLRSQQDHGTSQCKKCFGSFTWRVVQDTRYETYQTSSAGLAAENLQLRDELDKMRQNRREENQQIESRIDDITEELAVTQRLLKGEEQERERRQHDIEALEQQLRFATAAASNSDKHRRESDELKEQIKHLQGLRDDEHKKYDEKVAEIVNLSAHLSGVEDQRDKLISDIEGAHRQAREALPDYPWRAHCSETVGATAHEAVWALRTALEGTNLANGDCHKRIQELEQAAALRPTVERGEISKLNLQLQELTRDRDEWRDQCQEARQHGNKLAAELSTKKAASDNCPGCARLDKNLLETEQDRQEWRSECQETRKRVQHLSAENIRLKDQLIAKAAVINAQAVKIQGMVGCSADAGFVTKDNCAHVYHTNVCLTELLKDKKAELAVLQTKFDGQTSEIKQLKVRLGETNRNWSLSAEGAIKLKRAFDALKTSFDAQAETIKYLQGLIDYKDADGNTIRSMKESNKRLSERLQECDVLIYALEAEAKRLEEVARSQMTLTCTKNEQAVRAERALIRIKQQIDDVLKEESK
jgi:chromosome segregation ATPase